MGKDGVEGPGRNNNATNRPEIHAKALFYACEGTMRRGGGEKSSLFFACPLFRRPRYLPAAARTGPHKTLQSPTPYKLNLKPLLGCMASAGQSATLLQKNPCVAGLNAKPWCCRNVTLGGVEGGTVFTYIQTSRDTRHAFLNALLYLSVFSRSVMGRGGNPGDG